MCSDRTAIHEAAHAVVAEQLAPRVIHKASVVPDRQGLGHVLYDEAVLADMTNLDLAVVIAAGPLAEALFSEEFGDLAHLNWRRDAVLNAIELIEATKDAIFRVADDLMVQSELTGSQVRKVIRSRMKERVERGQNWGQEGP